MILSLTVQGKTIPLNGSSYLLTVDGVTEDDYLALSSEDIRVEFVWGRLFIHSPASTIHERIFGFLFSLAREYCLLQQLGEVFGSRLSVKLGEELRLEPDLLFITEDDREALSPTLFAGTPRWVVEILSPSTRSYDLGQKLQIYKQFGVGEIWLIDPYQQWLRQLVAKKDRYDDNIIKEGRVFSVILKDFWIELNWLWEEPSPPITRCLGTIRKASN